MYQLLVFDWDGTIMDSEAKIVACLQAAAIDLEIDPPAEDQARQVIGLGLIEAVARLFPDAPSALHQPLADRYREHFLELNRTQPRLFPRAREVLEQLSSDYLLAVATGKSRRGLDKELDDTGLRPLFQANRCADETLSKPHPQMLQEILLELGVNAAETLVIGDTEFDMQMAANAGVAALGVSYGVHDRERLLLHGALHCLDAIHELPEWINNNG
jgi:phosphoglycolate phosphatase